MNIKVTCENNIALLYTPYNADFVSAIKNIGGAKWDRTQRAWSIPEQALPEARGIMMRIYGESDLPSGEGRVAVKLTFTEEISAIHAPVTILGKTISSAHGRDSGARPGEDVTFLIGTPESGGSVKNWCSRVPEDSVVMLYNVPRSLLENATLPDGVSVEIVEDRIDRSALLSERDKLVARLAEIDRLLAEEE